MVKIAVIPEATKILAAVNEKFEPLHGTEPDILGNREAATAIDETVRHVIS